MSGTLQSVGVLGALALAFGLATGCTVEEEGRDGVGGGVVADRGDPGAALAGSCEGACGDRSAGGCWCDAQCVDYGDCCEDKVKVCDGGGGDPGGGGGDPGGEEPPPPPPGQLCFPGPSGNNDVCVGLVDGSSVGSGYNYPPPLSGNVNYRAPIKYIDLETAGNLQVAANFTLNEVAQSWKGRYAVVQPHAIKHLQELRNELGAIKVNSGYRRPAYNESVGGAKHSRHMYGDAFDLAPQSVSLGTLESACTKHGGKLVKYNSHVHCDWRWDAVNSLLFGSAALGGEPDFALTMGLSAYLEQRDGQWYAPAEGFDEGEPYREWTALDADGDVIYQTTGESFTPPSGTATIEVVVGAQIELTSGIME